MMIKFSFLFLSVILLMPISVGTNTENTRNRSHAYTELQPLIKAYDRYINSSLSTSQIPGAAVAIVKDSVILFLKGFGVKRIGSTDSVSVNTIFRLASVSKGFSSVLAGIIVSDNLISWQDKIVTCIPDFSLKTVEAANKISVTHLLSHTTGLPYHAFTNLIEYGKDLSFIKSKFKEIEPIAEPGTVYSYQNAVYSFIDEILASATGKSFTDLLQEKIFTPLDMKDASYSYKSIVNNPAAARPHIHGAESYHEIKISDKYYNAVPAGGINASISDMAKWLLALLGNNPDVIQPEILEQIFKPQIQTPVRYKYIRFWRKLQKTYYALGWRIFEYNGQLIAYHGGYVNGYRSEIALDRNNKIGICVLTNAPSRFANECLPAFFDMYLNHKDSLNKQNKQIAETM